MPAMTSQHIEAIVAHSRAQQEASEEYLTCLQCKQEYPRFRRGVIPNFVPVDGGDTYVCMECKKVEPRFCPRCEKERPRFDEQGESNFHPVLKRPGEIEYICSSCKAAEANAGKRGNCWGVS